jgi:uncharacterized NAD-dependent epimerase/dehydratase family protein
MRRIAILAEGHFDPYTAKTAVGVIRYGQDHVVAVIDSQHAGQSAGAALGDPTGPAQSIPVVAGVAEALAHGPDTLLIGIAPRGGRLPDEWRPEVLLAIRSGLTIISGLHHFLGDDAELAAAAREHGVTIWDVRRPPEATALRIASFAPRRAASRVVYFAGSDCNVGKMTAALEVGREARRRGLSSAFAATGQTGIMISGRGIPVDRYICDFEAGGVEALVQEFAAEFDWVFVEGQGSLGHPAYSAVTLGLLHGATPDYLLLCHHAGRTQISGYPGVPIPPLGEVRAMYETAAAWLRPTRTVGVVLNTFGMSEADAHAALRAAEQELGLPATDPVRFGSGVLIDALLAADRERAGGEV